jgi:hypothetical protein
MGLSKNAKIGIVGLLCIIILIVGLLFAFSSIIASKPMFVTVSGSSCYYSGESTELLFIELNNSGAVITTYSTPVINGTGIYSITLPNNHLYDVSLFDYTGSPYYQRSLGTLSVDQSSSQLLHNFTIC